VSVFRKACLEKACFCAAVIVPEELQLFFGKSTWRDQVKKALRGLFGHRCARQQRLGSSMQSGPFRGTGASSCAILRSFTPNRRSLISPKRRLIAPDDTASPFKWKDSIALTGASDYTTKQGVMTLDLQKRSFMSAAS